MAETPTFKLVLVGDGGTGKVCFFFSFVITVHRRPSISHAALTTPFRAGAFSAVAHVTSTVSTAPRDND